MSSKHWRFVENGRALIRNGDFLNGWLSYEHRWSLPESFGNRDIDIPLWDGSPLENRTLLLWCEQGYGDAIQFCRYAPMISGKVILACPVPLLSLFQTLGVQVTPFGWPLPEFDVHLPLMSLPCVLETEEHTIPATVPYLHATAGPPKGIGYAHRGTPEQRDIPPRSCPNEYFLKIHANTRSIQDGFTDFKQVAEAIMACEMIISIDTAHAHLAGSLGKKVFLILSSEACWRWMYGEKSPWYPTMRIFRQTEPGNWDTVFEEINREL